MQQQYVKNMTPMSPENERRLKKEVQKYKLGIGMTAILFIGGLVTLYMYYTHPSVLIGLEDASQGDTLGIGITFICAAPFILYFFVKRYRTLQYDLQQKFKIVAQCILQEKRNNPRKNNISPSFLYAFGGSLVNYPKKKSRHTPRYYLYFEGLEHPVPMKQYVFDLMKQGALYQLELTQKSEFLFQVSDPENGEILYTND